jgi:hypothetical protein
MPLSEPVFRQSRIWAREETIRAKGNIFDRELESSSYLARFVRSAERANLVNPKFRRMFAVRISTSNEQITA